MTEQEQKYVEEFFKDEVTANSEYVYRQFFKEVKHPDLQNYLLQATSAKALDEEFFIRLVTNVVKTNLELPKLEFLFDIFSNFGSKLGS